jgi:hypothetical protein
MAQVFKLRNGRVFCATVVVALLLGGGEAAPVWSLALPLETPTVPVKVPSVPPPVETPTVTVQVPTVTTPPVKTPSVPVPTVTVKAPSVSVNTTSSPTTTSPKAPSVSINSPTVSVKAPSVSVGTSTGSAGATSSSGSSSGVTGSSTSRPAGAGSAAGASGASGAPGSASTPGTYGSPGAGYGELPPIEGTPGRRARARIASREHLLKATVARFQGCLVALPASNRRLLELRTGYGKARPLSPRAAAARLHIGSARLARLEKQAVHELNDAAASNGCARTGEVIEAALSLIGAGFGGGHAGIARTELASFRASRPLAPTSAPTLVGRVLGVDVPPVASDLVIVLLLGTLLGGTVVLLFADAAGKGPRHEEWRRRAIDRLRSMR